MKRFLLLIAPLLFVLDFFLKKFVVAFSPEILSGSMNIRFNILPFIDFHLAYVENTGMAWGMFSSFQFVILLMRILVIGAIIVGIVRSKQMREIMFPLSIIVFGALANVIDTFIYGHVVDMLSFTFWGRSYGIFNIADAMIFLGAFMIIFSRKKSYATS